MYIYDFEYLIHTFVTYVVSYVNDMSVTHINYINIVTYRHFPHFTFQNYIIKNHVYFRASFHTGFITYPKTPFFTKDVQ